jgi:hypothetical protein
MLQQELTATKLSEESPFFLKFMDGLKLSKLPTNDFLVSINQAVLQRT